MNFYQQNRASRTNLRRKTITILVLILILTALQFTHSNPFSGMMHTLARPVLVAKQKVVQKGAVYFSLLYDKRSLIEENKMLQEKLAMLMHLQLKESLLREENIMLKTLLGRGEARHMVLATVLTRPNVSLYDTFIVDVGRTSSISKGDQVAVLGDFVIGTIEEVYRNSSLVTLFSAPGVKTNALIGPTKLLVIAEGRGGGNFEARLPHGIDIQKNDVIVLPNINTQVLGVVEEIIATPTGAFQTILFKNPINMAEVAFVQIIPAILE